jgi:hypothetical protein
LSLASISHSCPGQPRPRLAAIMNPYNEAIVTSEVGDEAVMRKAEALARCVGARAIAMGGSISAVVNRP